MKVTLFITLVILLSCASKNSKQTNVKKSNNELIIDSITNAKVQFIDTFKYSIEEKNHQKETIKDLKILNYILKFRSLSKLNDFIFNTDSIYEKLSGDWKIFREICPNFSEGVYYFTKQFEIAKLHWITYEYKVKILEKNNKLFFYEVSELRRKNTKGKWVPYFDKIFDFKDVNIYDEFEKKFEAFYKVKLLKEDLFIDYLSFGNSCKLNYNAENQYKEMNLSVEKNDKIKLLTLLKSANLEKQMYGILGLSEISYNGNTLTEEEKKIVYYILNKKGNINVCQENKYWNCKQELLKENFKFL